jgi:hypothetical protein
MNSQDGTILGYPLDNVLYWVNIGYLTSVGIAAALSIAVWRFSAMSNASKDLRLAQYQSDAKVLIERAQADAETGRATAQQARADAATANQKAEEERVARTQLEAQIADAQARTAEAQLQLERIKKQVGARVIPEDEFLKRLVGHNAPKSVRIWFSEDAVDGAQLALQLQSLLNKAKWNPSPPSSLPRDDPLLKLGVGTFAAIRSQVVVMGPFASQDASSAFFGIRDAIAGALGDVVGVLQGNVPTTEVWIVILPKL